MKKILDLLVFTVLITGLTMVVPAHANNIAVGTPTLTGQNATAEDGIDPLTSVAVLAHTGNRDVDRVRAIKQILDWGYEEQLLVTNDICLKCMLHHYGGWGYDHILRNIVPMMEDEGIPREAIDRILSDNPKRVLGS